MQENFIKTGKQNFSNINEPEQQPSWPMALMSDMGDDEKFQPIVTEGVNLYLPNDQMHHVEKAGK